MNVVYNNETNGYTDEATKLDYKTREAIKEIVKSELKEGTPCEALEYVMIHAIHMEIIKTKIELTKKNKAEKEN